MPSPRVALLVALLVTALVTAISHLSPDAYANTAVGAVFLGATYWLVLRRDTETVRRFGLSLGGVTEPEPLDPRRMIREGLGALGWALLFALVFFPPFWLGYVYWWNAGDFRLALPDEFPSHVLGQLLVIALPEEAFYRGYLQTSLDSAWSDKTVNLLGARVGLGWLVSAAIFAVGHLLTIPYPGRLAVFFPALAFGWLRARTGGVGAGIAFHALCNLLTAVLAESYRLHP